MDQASIHARPDSVVFVLPGGEHTQPAGTRSIKQMILDVVQGELAAH